MTQRDTANEETLLHQIVDTIDREVSPETIILFGSCAREDSRPDSDVDLLIVESDPFSPQRSRRREAARLYIALKELNVSMLYSREEFDHWKSSTNHVIGRAVREGKVLYSQFSSGMFDQITILQD